MIQLSNGVKKKKNDRYELLIVYILLQAIRIDKENSKYNEK